MKTSQCKIRIGSERTYLLIILSLLANVAIIGQITIGSAERPQRGAILDLKDRETTPGNEGGITSNKGLILPRVHLTSDTELYPMLTGNEPDYATILKKQHIGLAVYNTNGTTAPFNSKDKGTGIYTWNGVKWHKVSNSEITNEVDITKGSGMSDPTMYSHQYLYEPNCYVVSPGGTSEPIHVAKAYSMWEDYRIPSNSKNHANKSLAESLNISLNPTSVSIRVLWQDNPNLIPQNGIRTNGSGKNMTFTVSTSNNRNGNAIVAAIIDGTIRWSWHIWVTPFDPEQASNQTELVNTTVASKYVFMTMNLGATVIKPSNPLSMGLLYQWGRKDPFPSSQDFEENTPAKLYNLAGQSLIEETTGIKNENIPTGNIGNLNLMNAIINPMTFYKQTNISTNTAYPTMDWYTNLGYNSLEGDRTGIMNDQLWEENGRKTPFDPCPRGWKVPTWKNDNSAWLYVPAEGQSSPTLYGDIGPYAANRGLHLEGKADYKIGYYPATGYKDKNTGQLLKVGQSGHFWSASVYALPNSYSYSLLFNESHVYPNNPRYRADALSVRCVRE